jgi:hypothetical protein
MYIVSIVLFVGGMLMFGFAFSLGDPWRQIVFVGAILAISAAMALPIHTTRRNMTSGSPPSS